MRAEGAHCVAVQVGASDVAAVERLFDTATVELGPVTGLVDNA